MWLLVIRDIDRMPRTRAAVQGLDPNRPWSEKNEQLALLDMRWQALYGLLHVGLRMQGPPPEIKPYPVPQPKDTDGQTQAAARKPDPRKQAYLERFSPSARRRHLTLVKTPPPPT